MASDPDSNCTDRPLIYKDGIIRPNRCRGVPVTAQLLLGARYLESRRQYLYWNPVTGILLAGRQNTVTNSTNSAIIGSTGINLNNSSGVVVAGLDFSELIGSQITGFQNTLITDTLVATRKVRIGSLQDQGSSVFFPPGCDPNLCINWPAGTEACFCGEREFSRSSSSEKSRGGYGGREFQQGSRGEKPRGGCRGCSSTTAQIFEPILDVYGSVHIRADVAIDGMIRSGQISSTGITATNGSFSKLVAGSVSGSILEIPTEVFSINGLDYYNTVLAAPLETSKTVILDDSVQGFIPAQTITFKDNTLEYAVSSAFNYNVAVDPESYIEIRNPFGSLVRVQGGTYIIDTVGGSATFVWRDLSKTWLLTAELRGSPRLLTE